MKDAVYFDFIYCMPEITEKRRAVTVSTAHGRLVNICTVLRPILAIALF
jgi:hypothetical protein